MPLPKDPQKAQEYREKQRRHALERIAAGTFGNTGNHDPSAMIAWNRAHRNDLEERKRRSDRAKALGYGKWMTGRVPSRETVEKRVAHRRGKTYDEIYGERASEECEKRKAGNQRAWSGRPRVFTPDGLARLSAARKGKTYRVIYGERADLERAMRSATHRRRALARRRKADIRPKHNASFEYTDWRTAVFARDDYKCQQCGKRGGQLHAHHIKPWAKYLELRYIVSNGLTLCVECHKEHHRARHREAFKLAGVPDSTVYAPAHVTALR